MRERSWYGVVPTWWFTGTGTEQVASSRAQVCSVVVCVVHTHLLFTTCMYVLCMCTMVLCMNVWMYEWLIVNVWFVPVHRFSTVVYTQYTHIHTLTYMNVHAVCTSTNHVCTSMYALVVQFLKFYYMCNMSTLRIIGIGVFKLLLLLHCTFQNFFRFQSFRFRSFTTWPMPCYVHTCILYVCMYVHIQLQLYIHTHEHIHHDRSHVH